MTSPEERAARKERERMVNAYYTEKIRDFQAKAQGNGPFRKAYARTVKRLFRAWAEAIRGQAR